MIDIGGASTLNDSFRAARMGGTVALGEFAFEEARAAFQRLKTGAHFGKVVIRGRPTTVTA